MTIQQFVDKAKRGGFDTRTWVEICGRGDSTVFTALFLEPDAWKAVGKVEGWGEYHGSFYASAHETWHANMLGMIDALAEGKSIEDFLATL